MRHVSVDVTTPGDVRASTGAGGPERRPTRVRLRSALLTPSGRRVHLAKMLTWRVTATVTTVLVTYLVTGDLLVGATVGGIEATAKMGLYYAHERAWARIVDVR